MTMLLQKNTSMNSCKAVCKGHQAINASSACLAVDLASTAMRAVAGASAWLHFWALSWLLLLALAVGWRVAAGRLVSVAGQLASIVGGLAVV